MPGTSKITKVMMVRLPVDVAKKVERIAAGKNLGVSEYLRRVVMDRVARRR